MTVDKAKSVAMLAAAMICYAVMWWMLVNGLATGVILGINKGGAQPVALVTQPGLYWFFVIFYCRYHWSYYVDYVMVGYGEAKKRTG